jgi:hypothetical protein
MIKKANDWTFAFVLSLPMVAFFLGYLLNHPVDLIPTGFIQPDNVSYVAYAKQYNDANQFQLFYSNPFDIDSPAIYFQPQTLLFALFLKLGVSPGNILIPFTIICSVICFRLVIAIYDFLMPEKQFRKFHIWLLSWGGGMLVLAGIAVTPIKEGTVSLNDVFFLDPAQGWWGLNFGRSLFFSCEAYYHAIFLGCVYSLLRKNWKLSLVLMFILSVSHPFTGLELATIVLAWCFMEFMAGNRRLIPFWFLAASAAVVAFHVYYYLFYLDQFADHHSVSQQYTLNWKLRFFHMLPAYVFAGALAISSFYFQSAKRFFRSPSNRLFFCWFLMAFLLSNHELFMEAKQPVHFTRGYIWTSLFLLGIPALTKITPYFKKKFGISGLIVLALFFFVDNLTWVSLNILSRPQQTSTGYISTEQKQVLDLLEQHGSNQTTIVSSDQTIGFLTTVNTSAYPWYSHPYTTPFAERKKQIQNNFFVNGHLDSVFTQRLVIFVLKESDTVALKALEQMKKEFIIRHKPYVLIKNIPGISK